MTPVPGPPLTRAALGWDDHWQALFAPHDRPGQRPGRIIRHDGSAVLTAVDGETSQLDMRRSTAPLAVGDWVVAGGGTVIDILPRRSLLQRLDVSTGLSQPIAANVDVVMIVCGLDRPVKPGRIQRLLAQASDAGARPLLVLTKADVAADVEAATATARTIDPSLDVVTVSALAGEGMEELSPHTVDRTLVIVGESGAGKSTLVNVLCGDDLAVTGAVRAGDSKGRHTTSTRQLHLLPGGGCLIDTPGVRAVGMSAETDSVDETFADVAGFAVNCRFRDCQHDREPGCAVREATRRHDLPMQRLESWRRLRGEAESAELRADEQVRRQSRRRSPR